MKSFTILLSVASIASAAPHFPRDCNSTLSYNTTIPSNTTLTNTTPPGHYLPASITDRTFFSNSCTASTVSIRKEWRSLTHTEKMAFVDAELCFMALPNKTDLPGATNRFDDFQAAHQQGTNDTYGDIIHYTVSTDLPRTSKTTLVTSGVKDLADNGCEGTILAMA